LATGTRRRLIAAASCICLSLSFPAASLAETTITIAPTGTVGGTCVPLGGAGGASNWGPSAAFIYKNIPAFELKAGDILAFDTNQINEVDPQFEIALAATTINGSDIPSQPFTTVVTNTQTPANPRGNTVNGDFEVQFKAQAAFNFPGGGLIIRFANPTPAYALDTTCTTGVRTGDATDPSGFFVKRAYTDPDGIPPWTPSDAIAIGAFRVTTFPKPPSPPQCQGKTATITGTDGAETLNGTKGADVIAALGGNDKVNARKGNDLVCAGKGNDNAVGGVGNDRLNGDNGADGLLGGKGKDKLKGGKGKDILLGGPGTDTLAGGPGKDSVEQ
jgi:Ca2+-binding RTX toxin-like protein